MQPLDFEDGAERTISVSVENEERYFYCEVKEKTKAGLWKVVTNQDIVSNIIPHQQFTITVEDTNDPPMFFPPVKDAVVLENEGIGQLVEQFTAVDPDTTFTSDFVYVSCVQYTYKSVCFMLRILIANISNGYGNKCFQMYCTYFVLTFTTS